MFRSVYIRGAGQYTRNSSSIWPKIIGQTSRLTSLGLNQQLLKFVIARRIGMAVVLSESTIIASNRDPETVAVRFNFD